MRNFSFLLFSVFLLSACGSTEVETPQTPNGEKEEMVHIGFVAPLTGQMQKAGDEAVKAAALAVQEINTAGGIDGKKLDLVLADGKCSVEGGRAAAAALLEKNISVIIGGLCSSETVGVVQAAPSLPVISYCASTVDLAGLNDSFFRTVPSEIAQAEFAAKYIRGNLEKEKVATLFTTTPYSINLTQGFKNSFSVLGGSVSAAIQIADENPNYTELLLELKKSDAQAIYFSGKTPELEQFVGAAKNAGVSLPVIGTDALSDAKVSYSGSIEYPSLNMNKPEGWQARIAQYNISDTLCNARAYDTTVLVADAIKNRGMENIGETLSQISNYPGVAGAVTFDVNGDLSSAQYSIISLEK